MVGSALAIASSVSGGASDFLSGTNSRRIGTLRWMLGTQAIGIVLAAAWVVASGDPPPPLATLAIAAAAGIALMGALLAFFQAMVVGRISIVAPISATGVAIPIVAGIARGDRPSSLQAVGMAAAIAGVVLASRLPREGSAASAESGLRLALLAAVGGGVWFWLMAPASAHGVPWAVFIMRAIPALALVALLRARGASLRPAFVPRTAAIVAVSTLLGFAATVCYAYATLHGRLAIVAVLGSLYPVVTVMLAYRLLGERVHGPQLVGVVAVLAGVILLSAG